MENKNLQYVRSSQKRRRINLRRMCGDKCALCGQNKTPIALEFHHIKPENKSFAINDGHSRKLIDDIAEVEKCIMVCANCHREIHSGFYDEEELWKKQIIIEEIKQELLQTVEKRGEKNYCIDCGQEILKHSTRCRICNQKFITARKIDQYPMSKEELKEMIRTMSFVAIGEKYHCTDNNIKKYCKGYNLPFRKKDIKNYTDEEWEKI